MQTRRQALAGVPLALGRIIAAIGAYPCSVRQRDALAIADWDGRACRSRYPRWRPARRRTARRARQGAGPDGRPARLGGARSALARACSSGNRSRAARRARGRGGCRRRPLTVATVSASASDTPAPRWPARPSAHIVSIFALFV